MEALAQKVPDQASETETADFSYLSSMFGWKNTTFESIIPSLLSGALEGAVVDLSFKKNLDEDLNLIFEGLKMDNLGEENIGRNKKRMVRQLIIDQLGSKFTMIMEEHLKELGIRSKLVNNVKKAFGTCLVKSICTLNMTVMYEPETPLQAYLKTIPEDEVIPVDSDVEQLEPLEPVPEQEEIEKAVIPDKTLAERELFDKVTIINPNMEGGRILMYHQPASVMLRREILLSLTE